MRYAVIINNDERLANGDEDTLEIVEDEVTELLRSGYFDVEGVRALPSNPIVGE